MRGTKLQGESGPVTLGTIARAHLVLAVRCAQRNRHRAIVDPAEQAKRCGADLPVPEWASRLTCSQCGSR